MYTAVWVCVCVCVRVCACVCVCYNQYHYITQTGDLSEKGTLFRSSLSHFEHDILPNLSSHDCVLCLCGEGHHKEISETMSRSAGAPRWRGAAEKPCYVKLAAKVLNS